MDSIFQIDIPNFNILEIWYNNQDKHKRCTIPLCFGNIVYTIL
jgi:hypothetical protein